MRLRRRPKPEKVRATLGDMVGVQWGEEILRLRRVIRRALMQVNAGRYEEAAETLSEGLAERWWR